jgi:hypothetical protein
MNGGELEELLRQPVRPAKLTAADTHRDALNRVPTMHLTIAGALYIAQGGRCFHCPGCMPIFAGHPAKTKPPGKTSREHVFTKSQRLLMGGPGAGMTQIDAGAQLLAHTICNGDRGERPLRPDEWQRASLIWQRADQYWREDGHAKSPFARWIALANEQQQGAAP